MQTECNVYACLRMVMKQDLSTSLYVINNYLTHLLEWTAEYWQAYWQKFKVK